jgi:hypothetical protein
MLMKHLKYMLLVCGLIFGLIPAVAVATGGSGGSGDNGSGGNDNGGGQATPQGKAYGYYCRNESRQHSSSQGGQQEQGGTDFSRCVRALAQADRDGSTSGREACNDLSKRHVKGERGTAFSRCVRDVAQMRRDERQQGDGNDNTGGGQGNSGGDDNNSGGADNGGEGGNGGPQYTPAPQGKAYGYYCRDESKQQSSDESGQGGSDFSRCVRALAQAGKDDSTNGREACNDLSKRHVEGEQGTAFSRCVRDVAQMRQDEQQGGQQD